MCPRCAGFPILINLHVTGVGVDVIFTIAAISIVSMEAWSQHCMRLILPYMDCLEQDIRKSLDYDTLIKKF